MQIGLVCSRSGTRQSGRGMGCSARRPASTASCTSPTRAWRRRTRRSGASRAGRRCCRTASKSWRSCWSSCALASSSRRRWLRTTRALTRPGCLLFRCAACVTWRHRDAYAQTPAATRVCPAAPAFGAARHCAQSVQDKCRRLEERASSTMQQLQDANKRIAVLQTQAHTDAGSPARLAGSGDALVEVLVCIPLRCPIPHSTAHMSPSD